MASFPTAPPPPGTPASHNRPVSDWPPCGLTFRKRSNPIFGPRRRGNRQRLCVCCTDGAQSWAGGAGGPLCPRTQQRVAESSVCESLRTRGTAYFPSLAPDPGAEEAAADC